jgi:hypothetical protein
VLCFLQEAILPMLRAASKHVKLALMVLLAILMSVHVLPEHQTSL